MNTRRLLYYICTLWGTILTTLPLMADDTDMPIIAYMGVPNDQSTDQHFRDFSACGFNVSLYGYASLQQMIKACDIAQRHGVRILGHCPETHNTPELAAARLKSHKGFFGYVLEDEPSAPQIAVLQKEIVRLRRVDNEHCFYINLLPYYDEWVLAHTKTKTYDEYLEAATTASCQQLSFDYYPITYDGLRHTWFYTLEAIRRHSLKIGRPFWGFVLSVPHAVYPQPTLAALRLQVYTNLAYGAQAIQYFTYWTPQPEEENDYHNGPIDRDGTKTATYTLVQLMNQELKPVSRLFFGAEVVSVGHLGDIPNGAARQRKMPTNIRSLKVSGGRGAVVSELQKDDHRYLAVVNKDYQNAMRVDIKARNNTPRRLTKRLTEETLAQTYTVGAGDLLLVRLK